MHSPTTVFNTVILEINIWWPGSGIWFTVKDRLLELEMGQSQNKSCKKGEPQAGSPQTIKYKTATIVDDYTTKLATGPKPGETPVDGNYYTVPFISNVIEWTRSIELTQYPKEGSFRENLMRLCKLMIQEREEDPNGNFSYLQEAFAGWEKCKPLYDEQTAIAGALR